MANGNGGSLANAWRDFDNATKLNLAVTELDRIHGRLERHAQQSTDDHATIRGEFLDAITAVKADFTTRMNDLREEVHAGFKEMERRDSRKTALFYTMIGGLVVGLFLLVAQLASAT